MQTVALSNAALVLFRLHVERQGNMIVDDSNRAAYEELALAGLMKMVHSFLHGRNSVYGLTKEGFERKAELLSCIDWHLDLVHTASSSHSEKP